MHALFRVIICLLPLYVGPSLAQEEASKIFKVDWRSSSGNADQQSADFGNLYVTLYNAGNLLVRPVGYKAPLLIEEVMRAEGMFFGSYFPKALDNVLCDLNPSVCSRDLAQVGFKQLFEVTAHVGGYALSDSRWTVKDGDILNLPDYSFMPFATLKSVVVPLDWSVTDYVEDPGVDCRQWGETCTNLVVALNPPSLFETETEKNAILPTTGWQTSVSLPSDNASAYAKILEMTDLPQSAQFAGSDKFDTPWTIEIAKQSPVDLTVHGLEPNWVPIGTGSAMATYVPPSTVNDGVAREQQHQLLELIGHPFAESLDLDEKFRQPVGVVVLDKAFDPHHCDLPPVDGQDPSDIPCYGLVEANPEADHAVHVVGLIAAPLNGRGIDGLAPFSKVSFAQVDTRFSAPGDFDAFSLALAKAALANVRVANLSWGVVTEIGQRMFKQAAATSSGNMLLVVAAGNEAMNLDELDCVVQPACLDLPNVITVVGLDRNAESPSLWQSNSHNGSNSSRNFGIAAVAKDIISTVRGDHFGTLSGTSMAAPQVTAAAAMIYSAAEFVFAGAIAESGGVLSPKVVKDRLLYTADIFPGLQDQVMSGRLNTQRAINIVDTQLVLTGNGGPRHFAGTLSEVPSQSISCLIAGKEHIFPFASIRRLAFVPAVQRFLIFRQADASRSGDLEKIELCNLQTRSPKGMLVLHDGTEITFAMKEVLDLTAPLFE